MYIRFFLGGGQKQGECSGLPAPPPPGRSSPWDLLSYFSLAICSIHDRTLNAEKNSPNITQILFRNKIFKLVKVELGLQKDRLWHDKFLLYALQTNEMSSDLPPILLYEIHINMHSYQINLYYFVYNSI